MKLENLRSSFTVYLISSKPESLKAPITVFSDAGYVCLHFDQLTAAFSEIFTNPPHFVVFDLGEDHFDLKKAFREVAAQLPETHLLLFAPLEKRKEVGEFFAIGLYDVLWTPPISAREWVKALDRATERDYFMYMNEQLQKGGGQSSDFGRLIDLHKLLSTRRTPTECVQDFLEFGSRLLGDAGAVYFRFLSLRKILLAAQSHGILPEQWKGLGIDLNENRDFNWPMLRDPQSLEAIRDMAKEVFGRSDFQAYPLEIAKEIAGIVVFFGNGPKPEALELLTLAREFTEIASTALELEIRFHSVSTKDMSTGTYNRTHFRERATAELTRARRNLRPLALILIAIDQFAAATQAGGAEEGQAVQKVLARVFEKHSRINDLLARTGDDEFALLLPDTDIEGAAIKSERLRRMIEAGDFSQVLTHTPKITISIGVSEYPRVCSDVDDLFQTADEALSQVRPKTNRVCLAKPSGSFEPDFRPADKVEPA